GRSRPPARHVRQSEPARSRSPAQPTRWIWIFWPNSEMVARSSPPPRWTTRICFIVNSLPADRAIESHIGRPGLGGGVSPGLLYHRRSVLEDNVCRPAVMFSQL